MGKPRLLGRMGIRTASFLSSAPASGCGWQLQPRPMTSTREQHTTEGSTCNEPERIGAQRARRPPPSAFSAIVCCGLPCSLQLERGVDQAGGPARPNPHRGQAGARHTRDPRRPHRGGGRSEPGVSYLGTTAREQLEARRPRGEGAGGGSPGVRRTSSTLCELRKPISLPPRASLPRHAITSTAKIRFSSKAGRRAQSTIRRHRRDRPPNRRLTRRRHN